MLICTQLGKIPLRHLVYRVHQLPQSLIPLVWDFGTLQSTRHKETDNESQYITQMVAKFVSESFLGASIFCFILPLINRQILKFDFTAYISIIAASRFIDKDLNGTRFLGC